MTHSEPPPRDVPQDLTAAEYFELGLKYKEVGWTEQAVIRCLLKPSK